MEKKQQQIPLWEKYTLNINEAAKYYGVGVKKLYEIIRSNPGADFILEVGTHYRIKRVRFEAFLDETNSL